jgi:hypothetical protein
MSAAIHGRSYDLAEPDPKVGGRGLARDFLGQREAIAAAIWFHRGTIATKLA